MAPNPPPLKEITISLKNEIERIDQFFVLVLDDYEMISNRAVHDLLSEFLVYPSRKVHLVLCTRTDPLMPLVKLRARSQLTEIRAQDLQFTEEEAFEFIQKTLDSTIDKAIAGSLTADSEGWITGIQLAVLTLRHRVGKQHIEGKPTANNRYVSDYLMAEILDNQVPIFSEWLLKTSILARFNPKLCEAVCLDERFGSSQVEGSPQMDGDRFLKWLVGSNLFAIPLDDYHHWVRYHHLFRNFLQTELARRYDKNEISALHLRASQWYAAQGLMDEALQHALESGNLAAAAQLVEQNGPAMLDDDKWFVLEKWLAKLPKDIIQQRPKLLLGRIWVHFHHFALLEIPPLLETVETLLDDESSTLQLWGEVDFFWGHHWFWLGQTTRSLDHFHRALERIPKTSPMARGHAELFWGVAMQMAGQEKEAVQALKNWLYYDDALPPIRQTRLDGALIFIYLLSGELTEASRRSQLFLKAVEKYNNTYAIAMGHYFNAFGYYFWNDLERAAHHLSQAVEMRHSLHTRIAIDSLAGLTLSYQAMGEPDQASSTLALLLEFARNTNDLAYLSVARSCQAHLALLQEDRISTRRWLQTADLVSDTNVMFFFIELSQITQCRVLIAQGTETSLQHALDLLQVYQEKLEAQHNTRQLIDVLLLQALAYQKESQIDQALAAVERAITLAQPDGWIRPFVELRPDIVPLLTRHFDQQDPTNYAHKLFAACKIKEGVESSISKYQSTQLTELLTNREIEIYELLIKRLTNQEIAAELYISVGTVQQHLNHIYAKLNVKGRRQAIAKAAELVNSRTDK
jgi:LuxR family maltose regulon positive regulatory protein